MDSINIIIAAMDSEINALLNVLNNYQEITINNQISYKFELNDEKYLLVKGKIGKANTAYFLGYLFTTYQVKRVFNIGTSGGVGKGIRINDVVIATKVGYHDADTTLFGYQLGQIPGEDLFFECDNEFIDSKKIDEKYSIKRGLILSGDSFINSKNYSKSNLPLFEDCLCCEMESATVGQICHKVGIPFVIIRSISDVVNQEFNFDDNDKNVSSSSTNSALVLLELLK